MRRRTKNHNQHRQLSLSVALAALLISPAASADQGRDFIDEARLFYRAVACGSDVVPAGMDARIVKFHCRQQRPGMKRLRDVYVKRTRKFFAKHIPAGLPDKVVYPFGGGDLVSALATYPDAVEYTTISLEHAGDPRRLAALNRKQLGKSLELFRTSVRGLLRKFDSKSVDLRQMERGPIPGQIAFFMIALVAHDYEPVSLKFFTFNPDGSLHYYTRAEIEKHAGTMAKKKKSNWINTDYSVVFSNMELGFRKQGDASAPVRYHRHIASNLDDEHFPDSPLSKHLAAKGKVSTMTKAASYLLWMTKFSGIRSYLLDHMAFMISDTTGIPPSYARRFGFAQTTFGKYDGPMLDYAARIGPHDKAFQALWQKQQRRHLPFRYGYTDLNKQFHLVITRPAQRK